MNYEEKYNKVIEKIQHLLEDAKNNRHIIVRVEDIEKAFPEVKESEDERIRRNIRELLLDSPAAELVGHNIDLEQALTWLERQGGNLVKNGYTDNKDLIKYADNYSHEIWHKLMDNFKNIKDYHIGCNDVSDIVLNAIIDTYNWLEKQKSYCTFEIKEGHWYKCVCDYMLNNSDLMFKNDKLYYCRSDWRLKGEIDERNVKDIGVNGYKSFFRPATNQEIKDWLEKQEQRLA